MLNDADIKHLESMLMDERIEQERLPIEAVDGLIAAVFCGPKQPQKADWWSIVWKGEAIPEGEPLVDEIHDAIMKLYSETYYWLTREHQYSPIFLHQNFAEDEDRMLAAQLWCVGFLQGHHFHGDHWQSGLPEKIRYAMTPMLVVGMSDENLDKTGLLEPDEDKRAIREQLMHTLPQAVSTLYQHWHQEKAPDKPGRNEPCPCGNGKKYKKCCGASV